MEEQYLFMAVSFSFFIFIIASKINIYKCTFQNNYAFNNGGAIYLASFSSITISKDSIFKNNYCENKGSDIYAIDSEENFVLDNVNFDTTGSTLHLENIRFKGRKILFSKKAY